MKEYKSYMDNITVTSDLHEKILNRAAQPSKRKSQNRVWLRVVLPAACAAVLVLGVFTIPVLINIITNGNDIETTSKYDPDYDPYDEDDYPDMVRTSDESTVELTLKQAMIDPEFGAYVSIDVPGEFKFLCALRTDDRFENSLFILWANDDNGRISWYIGKSSVEDEQRVVYIKELEKYDLRLYSYPLDDSVSGELRECLENPVFLADELTLETISSRVYTQQDRNDEPVNRMDFSVLYDDIIILINAISAKPEQLFDMLSGIGNTP